MKKKYTLSPEGKENIRTAAKRMWQMIEPRDRQAIAASGGRARAAKMTPEQRKAHGKMMVDSRITKTLQPQHSAPQSHQS